jgi:exopolyphosphatase/guanosine-5'-triphosphate,3'-diphosphate pyrophosphatase
MRVAVVDIGTNSTRLLIAEVEHGRVTEEHVRESNVTRLGQGVDKTGELAPEAMSRVYAVLDRYCATIESHGVTATVAVLTSAVRDASNGGAFTETVRNHFGLDARTIPGEVEAELSFLGATSERPPSDDRIVVIDIGGGSTEFIVGRGGTVEFFVSLQMGVVRMTERHLHDDPPAAEQIEALIADARSVIAAGIPDDVRQGIAGAVAVAGTATSAAAMDLGLEPYDPDRVHGHVVTAEALNDLLGRLAAMTNDERREVPGLHPDRAVTIVAGVAMLRECAGAFGLDRVEVSEHDILRGAAISRAAEAADA